MLHAESDADVLIVQTAVQCATKCVTTIIGEDTDILVLLCFHSELPIYFKSDIKRSSKHIRVCNINWMKTALGPSVCEVLPFVHAIDLTLGHVYFALGREHFWRNWRVIRTSKKKAEIFLTDVSMDSIISAGEEAIVSLYGGYVGEALDKLLYRRFLEKLATNISSVQVHTLPITPNCSSCSISQYTCVLPSTWVDW